MFGVPVAAVLLCMSEDEGTITVGLLLFASWIAYIWISVSLHTFKFLQFQPLSVQYRMFQALCQEKKRRDEYENLLLLQKIEELHSAVANAQSQDKTSS